MFSRMLFEACPEHSITSFHVFSSLLVDPFAANKPKIGGVVEEFYGSLL